jgi:plasmid stabilization system protein ParE
VTRKVVWSQAAVDDVLAIIDELRAGAGAALAAEARLDATIESLDELANRGQTRSG